MMPVDNCWHTELLQWVENKWVFCTFSGEGFLKSDDKFTCLLNWRNIIIITKCFNCKTFEKLGWSYRRTDKYEKQKGKNTKNEWHWQRGALLYSTEILCHNCTVSSHYNNNKKRNKWTLTAVHMHSKLVVSCNKCFSSSLMMGGHTRWM